MCYQSVTSHYFSAVPKRPLVSPTFTIREDLRERTPVFQGSDSKGLPHNYDLLWSWWRISGGG